MLINPFHIPSYRAIYGPQINYFNEIFNEFSIFLRGVLTVYYVEQDVNLA